MQRGDGAGCKIVMLECWHAEIRDGVKDRRSGPGEGWVMGGLDSDRVWGGVAAVGGGWGLVRKQATHTELVADMISHSDWGSKRRAQDIEMASAASS